ncbi:agmatine ureohydrolase [Histoplasma capsulatum]|uniref:Agmatine ureohydrolase n=1 Tax=Ajellomyces capsulatus TaxID=5037 RepID=A0A8A1MDQ9_AJECA|nr:agmatine ureohydrolase [Histoplasma capsulatum]
MLCIRGFKCLSSRRSRCLFGYPQCSALLAGSRHSTANLPIGDGVCRCLRLPIPRPGDIADFSKPLFAIVSSFLSFRSSKGNIASSQLKKGKDAASKLDKHPWRVSPKHLHQWSFSGVSTFAHLKHVKCLLEPDEHYDVAVLGVPFDTSVSFRPGARYNTRAAINPYLNWACILDCGDIPIMPFDNGVAERQMYEAFLELGTREAPNPIPGISHGKPKIVTLGGDHSITLPFTENRSPCCTSMRTLIPGTPSGTRRIGHLINPASTTVAFSTRPAMKG